MSDNATVKCSYCGLSTSGLCKQFIDSFFDQGNYKIWSHLKQPKLKWCSQNAASVKTAQGENINLYKFPAYILQYSILHFAIPHIINGMIFKSLINMVFLRCQVNMIIHSYEGKDPLFMRHLISPYEVLEIFMLGSFFMKTSLRQFFTSSCQETTSPLFTNGVLAVSHSQC